MKTFLALTVGFAACIGLAASAQDKKKDDAPKIAGSYTLVVGKKNGEAVDDKAKKTMYTIDDKKITIADADAKFVMSYEIDAKAKPMAIDMEILEGPFEGAKGMKAYGIIEVKGDTLKLAYAVEKEKRPKDFSGKDGHYFEFKKNKAK